MGELPNVSIQVVPLSAGAYSALNGDFAALGLDGGDMAYSEAYLGGQLIQDLAEVRTLDIRYDRSRAKALSEDASRNLIVELMEGLR